MQLQLKFELKISSPPFFYFQLGGHLGWKSGSPDTILEGVHPRIILQKFGCKLAQWLLRRRFLCEFPIESYVKLSSTVGAILVEGPNRPGHIFGRQPSNDYFIKILFLLSKWFQTRRFLWEFPIGSYVKLSSAVAAILVGVLKCRKQFWKRTTQE